MNRTFGAAEAPCPSRMRDVGFAQMQLVEFQFPQGLRGGSLLWPWGGKAGLRGVGKDKLAARGERCVGLVGSVRQSSH